MTQRRGGHGPCLVPGLEIRAGATVAGKYRIDGLVGTGASGVVLAAHSALLRRRVSLKIFTCYTEAQEDALAHRMEKARRAARLRSDHVARVVEIGLTEEAIPFVATEALTGVTLAEEMAARAKLPIDEAVSRALEICEGLAEAHALGLVHGNLKPANIFLADVERDAGRVHDAAAQNGARTLKILDFGSTSPVEAIGDQSTSAFFGSPAFLAPEQITGAAVDERADIWALGVLLYYLISGEFPFTADTVSGAFVAVVYDAAPLLTDAPYALSRIVHRCLDKDPLRRPANVAELAEALAPFARFGETEGARAAARVRIALESAPRELRAARMATVEASTSASASVPPVSVSTPVPSSTPSATPTKPSARLAPRRWSLRGRGTRGVAAAIVVGIGVLAMVSERTARDANAPAAQAQAPAIAPMMLEPMTAPNVEVETVPTLPPPPPPPSPPPETPTQETAKPPPPPKAQSRTRTSAQTSAQTPKRAATPPRATAPPPSTRPAPPARRTPSPSVSSRSAASTTRAPAPLPPPPARARDHAALRRWTIEKR